MVSLPTLSRRALLWNALISSALASLGLGALILLGFTLTTRRFSYDTYGQCMVCRYEVLGRISSSQWNSFFRNTAIVFSSLTVYALASVEAFLREDARLAQVHGRRLTLVLRPLTGEADLRVTCRRWGFRIIVVFVVQTCALMQLVAIRTVEANLAAGISHPLSALNETVLYAQIGDNISDASLDPRKMSSLRVANPFISYSQLYPNDTIDIPDGWANTSLYLPANHLPTLESHMHQSALEHFKYLGTWQPRTLGIVTNLTHTRGGYSIGDAVYPRTNTEGLGVNMTTYERFSGDGGAGLPRNFEFQSLFGESWVTNVSVRCYRFWGHREEWEPLPRGDAVSNDSAPVTEMWPPVNKDVMIVDAQSKTYRFHRPPSDELQVYTDFDLISSGDTLDTITSRGTEKQHLTTSLSVQTIIMPEWNKRFPLVNYYKCRYMPSEFHMAIMALADKPLRSFYATANNDSVYLQTGSPMTPAKSLSDDLGGKCLSPVYALPAARAIHELLSQGEPGSGGSLGRAFKTVGMTEYQRRSSLDKALEKVLSDTAQAYFSILRQRVERANAWPTLEQLSHPTKKIQILFFKIERLGGASAFAGLGLSVLVLMFLAMGTTFLRCCAAGIMPLVSKSNNGVSSKVNMADEKAAMKEETKTTDDLVKVDE